MSKQRTRQTRTQGMALIVVLWLVVLLCVMAAGHSRNAHTDTILTSRQVELAKARGLAEAGINHVILEMLARNSAGHPLNGSLFDTKVRDDVVVIAIRHASGLVDINTADSVMLDALFRAAAVETELRRQLVDAILDWRDKDDLSRPGGFEDDDYLASGRPWTSRDGAFLSIDELRYLPGMSQALFDRIAPLVTVHSGRSGLNVEYAPPVLIEALTGEEVPVAIGDDGAATSSRNAGNGTFHIYASAEGGGGTVASIEAVVRISRSSERPFLFLEWREPSRIEIAPREGVEG